MMADNLETNVFQYRYGVVFGDCDPAGIVFYPNIFVWMDRGFQYFLKDKAGGHAAICKELGSRGLGLINANCTFSLPIRQDDELVVAITAINFGPRTFDVKYQGSINGKTVFEGDEKRTMFVNKDGRIRAGDVSLLRSHLGL